MFRWTLLDAAHGPDRRVWISAWERSPMQLPFAHPGFGELVVPPGGRMLAALLEGEAGECEGGTVLYPFILRPIPGGCFDLMTPYSYGGPLHWGLDDLDRATQVFWDNFEQWAVWSGVVSEFVRFSLFDDVLPYPGVVEPRKVNYVNDLPSDAETMWAGLVPKIRRNVRKAERSGVTTVVDETGAMVEHFVRIFGGTMQRHSSDDAVTYDRRFLDRLQAELPGRIVYFYALVDDVPVSVDLMVLGRDTAYYFLGGTDADSFALRPNELVKTTVMDWLREHGYRRYVLGGGVHSEDGLERYKKGFAPEGARMFCTGQRVFDEQGYNQLVAARMAEFEQAGQAWDAASTFFPPYRRALEVPAVQPQPEPEPVGS